MMTPVEQQLLDVLTELDAAVRSDPKLGLLPLFARIDALAGHLPPSANPELRHFLQRKSYAKARLFLAGRNAEDSAGGGRSD